MSSICYFTLCSDICDYPARCLGFRDIGVLAFRLCGSYVVLWHLLRFYGVMMSSWWLLHLVALCHVALGEFYGFKMVLNNCYGSHGVLCSFMKQTLKNIVLHHTLESFHIITKKMIMRELILKFPNLYHVFVT